MAVGVDVAVKSLEDLEKGETCKNICADGTGEDHRGLDIELIAVVADGKKKELMENLKPLRGLADSLFRAPGSSLQY